MRHGTNSANTLSGFSLEIMRLFDALRLSINLFINSDTILNRDVLWSIQGKNHHVNAAIVRGIRHTGQVL